MLKKIVEVLNYPGADTLDVMQPRSTILFGGLAELLRI